MDCGSYIQGCAHLGLVSLCDPNKARNHAKKKTRITPTEGCLHAKDQVTAPAAPLPRHATSCHVMSCSAPLISIPLLRHVCARTRTRTRGLENQSNPPHTTASLGLITYSVLPKKTGGAVQFRSGPCDGSSWPCRCRRCACASRRSRAGRPRGSSCSLRSLRRAAPGSGLSGAGGA